MQKDDVFLTVTEVAEMIGVHRNTVKNWIEEGALPAWRTPGNHYRISKSALYSWLKERERERKRVDGEG